MGIEEDQSAAIGTKIAKSWKTFYSWEMKVLLTLILEYYLHAKYGNKAETGPM